MGTLFANEPEDSNSLKFIQFLLFMNSAFCDFVNWFYISYPFVTFFYYILGCTFLSSTHTLPATVHYMNLFKQICLNNPVHYDLPLTSIQISLPSWVNCFLHFSVLAFYCDLKENGWPQWWSYSSIFHHKQKS